MDVADNGYAQAASVPGPRPGPYDWPVTATDSIAELRGAVEAAARALRDGEPTEPAPVPRPPAEARAGRLQLQRGDAAGRRRWATTRARWPSACAAELERELGGGGSLERIEVAGPGFVNLFLADAWYRRALGAPASPPGRTSARPRPRRPERILVEFVSANPTGPLHVGGGRHAAYGDALVRLLEAAGHEVEREYYVNDAGTQIEPLRRLDRRPHERRASRPRTATTASTWPSWPSGSRPRGSTPPTSRRSAGAGSS